MKSIVLLIALLLSTVALYGQFIDQLFVAKPTTLATEYVIKDEHVILLEDKTYTVLARHKSNEMKGGTEVGTAVLLEKKQGRTFVKISLNKDVNIEATEPLLIQNLGIDYNLDYTSTLLKVLNYGIVFKGVEGGVIVDQSFRHVDGLYQEQLILKKLLEDVKFTAAEMRGQMKEPPITGGLFEGKKLFDVMETSTIENLQNFLAFMAEFPGKYMGHEWVFSEVYATWIINKTPQPEETAKKELANADWGLKLEVDNKTNFLRVKSISRAHWGRYKHTFGHIKNPLLPIEAGVIVLAINGRSTYKQTVADFKSELTNKKGARLQLKFIALNNVWKEVELVCQGIGATDDSKWLTIEQLPNEHDYPRLFPVRRGNKYGFIDATGTEVIPLKFDKLSYVTSFEEGLQPIQQNGKWGYINLVGTWVIKPTWDNSVSFFSDGLAHISKTKWALSSDVFYINTKGETVIKDFVEGYEKPAIGGNFSEGLAVIRRANDEQLTYMNAKGELAGLGHYKKANKFEEGLARVMNDKDLYGYINIKGETVIPFQYTAAADFKNGLAFVSKDDKTHYAIDKKGNIKVTFEALPMGVWGGFGFKEGHIRHVHKVSKDEVYFGLLNDEGKLVVKAEYVGMDYSVQEGLIPVTKTGKKEKGEFSKQGGWYYINPKGETIIKGPFQEANRFSEGLAWVKVENKWGLIDKEGNWRMKPAFDRAPSAFKNGITQFTIKRDEGGILPEEYYLYFNQYDQIIWQP